MDTNEFYAIRPNYEEISRLFGNVYINNELYPARTFISTERFENSDNISVSVDLIRDGVTQDFTKNYLGIPIITADFLELTNTFESEMVQAIPIKIRSQQAFNTEDVKFYILKVLKAIDCVDMERSILYPSSHVKSNESSRGHKFASIKLLYEKASGHHIFKIPNSPIPLIVSVSFKNMIEEHFLTGSLFFPV